METFWERDVYRRVTIERSLTQHGGGKYLGGCSGHAPCHCGPCTREFSTMIFPNVRLILVGGQSIGNGRLYNETWRLFPKERIVQTHACAEAGSSITFEDLGWGIEIDGNNNGCHKLSDGSMSQNDGLDGATYVSCPPPHIQIGIFNTEAPLENIARPPSLVLHGTMGIIGTRGPHVMSGYWNRGGDTPPTTNPSDGGDWMLMNDLGYIHPWSKKIYSSAGVPTM